MANRNSARPPEDSQYILGRFVKKLLVNQEKEYQGTPCWNWQGFIDKAGYSKWTQMGEYYAHRIAYRLFIGVIPADHDVDHVCRNRQCVNPLHLEAITHAENMRRMSEAVTHCPRGHEFTKENTVLRSYPGKKWTSKTCKICNNLTAQRFRERNPGYRGRYPRRKASQGGDQ